MVIVYHGQKIGINGRSSDTIDTACHRSTNVILDAEFFKSIKNGGFFVIGNGRNRHHVIYVNDLIEGLVRAAESGDAPGEVFVLSGKDAPTTSEMAAIIATHFGRRLPRFHAPMAPFMIAATVIEGVLRPLGIQPPLHRRRMDFFRKSYTFSGKKAAAALGFVPSTSFREGAAQTAEWYAEAGEL